MILRENWYLCSIVETDDSKPQPDWSKIPEAKQEEVKKKWASQNKKPAQEQWLWGPQIEKAIQTEGTTITIIREQTEEEAVAAVHQGSVPAGMMESARDSVRARYRM